MQTGNPIPVKDMLAKTLQDLLAEKPITKVTVDEIVSISGFSKRTFYNHFRDKNDLVAYIWRNIYISCWYDENGNMVPYRDFLLNYHRKEYEMVDFLRNTLPYAGQNNLWETVFSTGVEYLVIAMRHNGYQGEFDQLTATSIEYYVHGVNGLARAEFESTAIKHLYAPVPTPEERADLEYALLPETIKRWL